MLPRGVPPRKPDWGDDVAGSAGVLESEVNLMGSSTMKHLSRTFLGFTAVVIFTVCGCRSADRLTYDNFSRVQKSAHTQADVTGLLGEPTYRLNGIWIYERPSEHLVVKVEFDESGKVQRKEWVDGKTGQWEDTNK